MAAFEGAAIESNLIEECPLNIECRVVHEIDCRGSHRWFVGGIAAVHIGEGYDPGDALMFWGKEFRRVGAVLAKA